MRRLTFENARGEDIVFYLSPLVIEELIGIGEVGAELQGQAVPYQDGELYADTKLLPRYIDLQGSITKTDLKDIKSYRKKILRVCNPKLGLGKITLELDGDTKEIYGALDGVPSFPERGRRPFQPFMITWKCPNPYWRNPSQVSRSLRAYEGTFEFPFEFPIELGIEGDITTLVNEGDTATPVTISIQGPIDRPMIENRTTGQYMRVNVNLLENDVLFIDTDPLHKRVEIHRGNQIFKAMGYFEHSGDFWQLQVGRNDIRVQAERGVRQAIAAISWHDMFTGM